MGGGSLRVLLDTHALLWWFTDDDQLSVAAREVIADGSNDVLVSAASAGEIATKQRLGRLYDVPQAAERFSALVDADGHSSLDRSPAQPSSRKLSGRKSRSVRSHIGRSERTRAADAGNSRWRVRAVRRGNALVAKGSTDRSPAEPDAFGRL